MPAADGASFTRIVGRAFVRDTRQLLIHNIMVVSLDRGGNAEYYTHERAQLLGTFQPSKDDEPTERPLIAPLSPIQNRTTAPDKRTLSRGSPDNEHSPGCIRNPPPDSSHPTASIRYSQQRAQSPGERLRVSDWGSRRNKVLIGAYWRRTRLLAARAACMLYSSGVAYTHTYYVDNTRH